MRANVKRLLTGVCFLVLFTCFIGLPAADAATTITGTVNNNWEIVTDDGDIYEIEEGDKGDELAELIGVEVTVTGLVKEEEGYKRIEVTSFKVVED